MIAGRSSSVATYTEICIKMLMRIVDPGDIMRDHSDDLINAPVSYSSRLYCSFFNLSWPGSSRNISSRRSRNICVQLATQYNVMTTDGSKPWVMCKTKMGLAPFYPKHPLGLLVCRAPKILLPMHSLVAWEPPCKMCSALCGFP